METQHELMESIPNAKTNAERNEGGNDHTMGKSRSTSPIYLSRFFLSVIVRIKSLTTGKRLSIPLILLLEDSIRLRWLIS